jgi:hypothetical protein
MFEHALFAEKMFHETSQLYFFTRSVVRAGTDKRGYMQPACDLTFRTLGRVFSIWINCRPRMNMKWAPRLPPDAALSSFDHAVGDLIVSTSRTDGYDCSRSRDSRYFR